MKFMNKNSIKIRTNLGPEIDLIARCFINGVHDVLKRRFERKCFLNPNPVCKQQSRSATWAAAREDQGHKLRVKRVEVIGGTCFEESE
ncbi:hypothetical protein HanIR_Chr05g0239911 [Helianthus annuus]|nr:hypothetical protein HanIR_Chr05g0239881 [Helianthus annuus]KAJ0577782.1 hypothetical protein HanIR_Chr05g0239911 [Helianthus annuus]